MRKENEVLADNKMSFLLADDSKMLLAYKRYNDSDEIVVCFNCSGKQQTLSLANPEHNQYVDILSGKDSFLQRHPDSIELTMEPFTAAILKKTGN